MAGRSTEYTPSILTKTKAYLKNYSDLGDAIPSIAGLSCELERARSTIYKWKADNVDQEFSDTLEQIMSNQERTALNKGLTGDFNSAITKLILANHHGYSEKPELDQDEESPPVAITFEVKEAVSEIKVTRGKPKA